MLLEPRPLHNISHPFIDSIYIKKEFDGGGSEDGRNRMFFSFLADLDLIRDEVESKAGKFSRVDIRY